MSIFPIRLYNFYFHISVHRKSMYLEEQRDAVLSSLCLFYCQVTLHVSGVSRTTTGISHAVNYKVII